MPFRGFTGLRTYPFTLNRDLRELERYIGELDDKLSGLISSDSLGQSADGVGSTQPPNATLTKHAKTHATKINANTGSDPLDKFYMKWRKRQEILPDLGVATDVVLTVKPGSSAQTGDLLQVYDAMSEEALTTNSSGLTTLGDASQTARLNVKYSTMPVAVAPDEVALTPYFWMRGDDEEGQTADGNPANDIVERAGTLTKWSVGVGGANLPTYYDKDGASAVNSHAWLAQPASVASFTLAGLVQDTGGSYPSEVIFDGAFTIFAIYTCNTNFNTNNSTGWWLVGHGNGGSAEKSGIAFPGYAGNSRFQILTEDMAGTTEYVGINDTEVGVDDNDYDPSVSIAANTRVGIFRRAASGACKGLATRISNGSNPGQPQEYVETTNISNKTGRVQLPALFNIGIAQGAPPSVGVVELVIYNGYLSDSDVESLYQWGVQRAGLEEYLGTGSGGGDLAHFYDPSDNLLTTIDSVGYLGIGVDPTAPIHLRSTTSPQMKYEYSGTEYYTVDVGSTANITFDATGTDPKFCFEDPVCFNGGLEAPLTITGTTQPQFIIEHSTGNDADFSVDSNGNLTINVDGTGTAEQVNITDPVKITAPSGFTGDCILEVDNSAGPDKPIICTKPIGGGQSANWIQCHRQSGLGGEVYWAINETGQMESPHVGAQGISFDIISNGEQEPIAPSGTDISFKFALGTNVISLGGEPPTTRIPPYHTVWYTEGPTEIMMLEDDGTLRKGPVANDDLYWSKQDTATWAADHTFLTNVGIIGNLTVTGTFFNPVHGDPITLATKTTDGNTAYYFQDLTARTSGNILEIANTADSKQLCTISYDGKWVIGYAASLSGSSNALLSFSYNDSVAGKLVTTGMHGLVTHANTGLTQSRLAGIAGTAAVNTATGLTTDFVYGVCGAGIGAVDSAALSGKVLAGVVGIVNDNNTENATLPTTVDGGIGYIQDAVKGNWDHVSTFWANAQPNNLGSNPTNLPAICSAYRGTVPENTTGECWMLYGDLYTPTKYTNPTSKYYGYYAPALGASVAGSLRIPWPRHGTRRVHQYFIPGDLADTSSNVVGDVAFHDGTGSYSVGLHEHDGTDWRRLRGTSDKFWPFDSPSGSSGTFYFGGYYDHASGASNFAAAPTFGTANASYAAHLYIVIGAVPGATTTIRVSGTSITDAAVRTAADTEDITVGTGTSINDYFETSKKWLGQVTITHISGTQISCNYGWAKYWDFNNQAFVIKGLEVLWLGGANDTGANISLIHHKASGWTYNAGSTAAPPVLADMNTDHVTEVNVRNGEEGAWKRTNLNTAVAGGASEGVIWQIDTTSNKAFELGSLQIHITT